jgi:hypothetical protein
MHAQNQQTKSGKPGRRKLCQLIDYFRKKTDFIIKQREEKSWHRIIEGGVLVRITQSGSTCSAFVLGDHAIALMTDSEEKLSFAKGSLLKKAGSSDFVKDVSAGGITLYFVFRPIRFPANIGLTQKYSEMIGNMAGSGMHGVFKAVEAGSLRLMSEREITEQIEKSKPSDNYPS